MESGVAFLANSIASVMKGAMTPPVDAATRPQCDIVAPQYALRLIARRGPITNSPRIEPV